MAPFPSPLPLPFAHLGMEANLRHPLSRANLHLQHPVPFLSLPFGILKLFPLVDLHGRATVGHLLDFEEWHRNGVKLFHYMSIPQLQWGIEIEEARDREEKTKNKKKLALLGGGHLTQLEGAFWSELRGERDGKEEAVGLKLSVNAPSLVTVNVLVKYLKLSCHVSTYHWFLLSQVA